MGAHKFCKRRGRTIANAYLQNWAAGAFGANRAALYAFIDSLPENQPVLSPRHDAISGIQRHAGILRAFKEVFEDPRAPMLIVSLKSDPRIIGGERSDGVLLRLASTWARNNPVEMMEFTARITDPFLKRPLLEAAVTPLIEVDPAKALEWAMSVDPDGSLGVVSRGINAWLNKTDDPEGALNWVKADAGRQVHADLVAGIVASRLEAKKYPRAYEIALSIANESARHKALSNIAVLSRKDDAHFEYVKRSGNPELLDASVLTLAANQPQRAAELLGMMPAGQYKTEIEERLRNAKKPSGR
jgi:hypothetical protein